MTIILGLSILLSLPYFLEILIAASTASAPELQKKAFSKPDNLQSLSASFSCCLIMKAFDVCINVLD